MSRFFGKILSAGGLWGGRMEIFSKTRRAQTLTSPDEELLFLSVLFIFYEYHPYNLP
jgi:hypothetical protein